MLIWEHFLQLEVELKPSPASRGQQRPREITESGYRVKTKAAPELQREAWPRAGDTPFPATRSKMKTGVPCSNDKKNAFLSSAGSLDLSFAFHLMFNVGFLRHRDTGGVDADPQGPTL